MTQPSVKVEDLSSVLPAPEMWGAFKVQSTEGRRLELVGWVLGVNHDVKEVQVLAAGLVVASARPEIPREEIANQFPDRTGAANCGFRVVIEAQGKGSSTLQLRALLDDDSRISMGEIRVLAPSRRWTNVLRRS